MAKTTKASATPRLRFPEFRKTGPWRVERLDKVCDRITQGGTPDTTNPEYWNGDLAWLTPAEMGKNDSPFVASTDRKITEAGLANCSSELLPIHSVIISTRAPIGHLAINTSPMAINQGCKGLVPGVGLNFSFLYSALIQAKSRLIDLGAGNTFKELSGTALKSFLAAIPVPAEQQRVADCLTSLDDVIAAQARKVEALEAHKRGLMQQLFPRDGETVPRLRFAEFRNAPRWEAITLADLAKITSGTTPARSETEFFDGGTIPWVKTGDLNNSFIDATEERITPKARATVNPAGSVLVAMYGGIKQIGRTGLLRIPAATNQALSVLNVDRERALPRYVLWWLNAMVDRWKRIAGSSRKDPNITSVDVARFPILLPSKPEQQRVADCLSTLDDQIATELTRLDALRSHKAGLMQQLFPSPDAD